MPNQGLFQTQKQVQTQVLAPQLRQSLKILQVPSLELRNTILEELQTNPVLEELPSQDLSIEGGIHSDNKLGEEGGSTSSSLEEKILEHRRGEDEDWIAHLAETARLNPYNSEAAERRQHFFDSIESESSLQTQLMQQARLSGASIEEFNVLEYVIGSLDDNGLLPLSLEELATTLGKPLSTLQATLEILKTLEPSGLGAPDLRHCLLWQLEAKGQQNSLAAAILNKHYALLLRRRVPELAKVLKTSVEHIHSALEDISKLDPAPGRRYSEDQNRVVVPDLSIEKNGDAWLLSLRNEYIPRLRLNPTYRALMENDRLSSQEKTYIHDKMRAGESLIHSIAQRQETIKKIAEKILEFQKAFFERGVSQLKPLTMQQIADTLDLHETTISRAVANKYIQTPHGVFELKYFFTSGYQNHEGEAISAKSVKDKIAKLIAQENASKPLSDQAIADFLNEGEGSLKIARRTVAKYREALGILPTHLRKQH